MPTKDMEFAATTDEAGVTEAAEEAGGIRFGEDSKFLQVSINISFPFSSIVIPAGRRAGGGFFEFVRKAIPTRSEPKPVGEKEKKEERVSHPAGRRAA